ncbi:MAG: glycosyltransferase family 4 protein [Xanthobacteraceae bacterium]|nr:glycosyltransferase family 4 protein [Xanthobacteraceae bacterium]
MTKTPRRGGALFLAPVLPADRGNGLAMRVGFFLDAYAREYRVDLAVIPIASAGAKSEAFARSRAWRMQIFPRPVPDAHFSLIAAVRDPAERLAAFRRYQRPSLASFTGAATRQMLMGWIEGCTYDVVHVSRLYLAPLIDAWPNAGARPRFVIDCDEDDAAAYRQLARIVRRAGASVDADWADCEAKAFATLASSALPQFDLAFAASAGDAASLRRHSTALTLLPNVAPQAARPIRRRRHRSKMLLFVGTMGYAPNHDAARWLITRIWPRIRGGLKSPARLMIVGSNPGSALDRLGRQRNIVVTGAVDDIGEFYRRADVALIPVRAGGGTRIKLLEAAACGVPIVSTTFGAAGTTFRNGRDLLVADQEEQFARACLRILTRPRLAAALAARARRRVSQDYDAKAWSAWLAARLSRLAGQCD